MKAKEQQDRLIEAAVALLAGAPGRTLQTTNLNKALFYFDLALLRDAGRPFTFQPYLALSEGPVVARYKKRLLRPLEERGLAGQTEAAVGGYTAKPVALRAGVAPRLPELLIERARNVAQWAGRQTASEASEFSHDNPGWKLAYEEGLGGGASPMPIDMQLALQQIVSSDPWLDEAPDAAFGTFVDRVDSAATSPWA